MLFQTFPIISIVFNLIIVRIALGIAHGGNSGVHSTQNPPSGIVDGARSYQTGHVSQFPMKPLAVTVTQLVHKETDNEETPVKEREGDVDGASFTDDSAITARKERGSWNAV